MTTKWANRLLFLCLNSSGRPWRLLYRVGIGNEISCQKICHCCVCVIRKNLCTRHSNTTFWRPCLTRKIFFLYLRVCRKGRISSSFVLGIVINVDGRYLCVLTLPYTDKQKISDIPRTGFKYYVIPRKSLRVMMVAAIFTSYSSRQLAESSLRTRFVYDLLLFVTFSKRQQTFWNFIAHSLYCFRFPRIRFEV